MQLKLDALQKVVKDTLVEERAAATLKAEISRVFGPAVIVEGKLESVVASANDWLDVLDRTGRSSRLSFKPSVTASFLDYTHPEVRKFAARVCPEHFLAKMINDRNPDVRAAVAGRLSLNSIREMIKRFPKDDQLRSIFRQKKLHEAGVAKPEVKPIGIDPVDGAERLGDATRTQPGPELSEAWYKNLAERFLHNYGQNIEYAWEELAVRRYCSSVKATSLIEIDETKLLKSIKDLIREKEDNYMERNALKETLSWLEGQEKQENLREGILPELVEDVDPVAALVHSGIAGEAFVSRAAKLFRVQESMLPMAIRKYRLGEGSAKQTLVPIIGMLPHNHGFRSIDERALDMFCESWSKRQQIAGEPLKLEWTTHPSDCNKIGFSCILK